MDSSEQNKKWIAVYTKPRHEKTVEKELQKKGFEVYLPLLKQRRKWSDRKKWVEFPLFRSYIFVKTEIKNALFEDHLRSDNDVYMTCTCMYMTLYT